MNFVIDNLTGIFLALAAALIAGAIGGYRMARARPRDNMTRRLLRRSDVVLMPILVYVWIVGLLAAYPAYAAVHHNASVTFPIGLGILSLFTMAVSCLVWYVIFLIAKRGLEHYRLIMAVY